MGCSPCCDTPIQPITVKPQSGQETGDENEGELFGPQEQRECRDTIFLIIFLAFIGGIGVTAYMAANQGNPYRLVYGYDSYGNVCNQKNAEIENVSLSGQDNSNKTKVFYFDPTYFTSMMPNNPFPSLTQEETERICIEKCPDKDVEVEDFYKETGINLCLHGVTPYVADTKKCPPTPVSKHVDILNRCIPALIWNAAKAMTSSLVSILSTNSLMGNNLPQKIVSDLKNTLAEIGYLSALSVLIALLVLLLLKFLAAIIIWTLVIAVMVFSLAVTAYSWNSWISLDKEFNQLQEEVQTDEAKQKVRTWLIISIFLSAMVLILFLTLLVLRKRLALVIQLYAEAGKAIKCMPCLLLLPFTTLIILAVSVGGLCVIALYIETSGLPVANINGHVEFVMVPYWTYIRWYNIFAILWISSFIMACEDMVVAGAVASWYFTRKRERLFFPVLKSISRMLRYHLGSVALGSFIIAVVKLARITLGCIQYKLQGKVGKVATFIMKCLQCCLWCFEKFLKYINRNAYIEIAIYGENFCSSAQKAFILIVRNALRVAIINSIGDFILCLGKLSTVAIVMVIGRELLKNRDDINYIWVPISVACVVAFTVSHCFLLIYEITIDTIFLCFCEDCERNDGQSRPYYMSKNLMCTIKLYFTE